MGDIGEKRRTYEVMSTLGQEKELPPASDVPQEDRAEDRQSADT